MVGRSLPPRPLTDLPPARTSMAFLSTLFAEGVLLPSEGSVLYPQWSSQELELHLRQKAELLASKALLDSFFKGHRRSDIAAAIVLAARQALGVQPLWSAHLTDLTGCTSADVFDLCRVLSARTRLETASQQDADECLNREMSSLSIQSPTSCKLQTSKQLGVSPTSVAEGDK